MGIQPQRSQMVSIALTAATVMLGAGGGAYADTSRPLTVV